MAENDETYDPARIEALRENLLALADRIRLLSANGTLLQNVPELLQRLGDLRSELFHYEVRSTYDSPEMAERRRLVDEARNAALDFLSPDPEDDEPWRKPLPE